MGSALDPSGFQLSAVIRTTDGYSVNLWMKGSRGGLDGAVDDALNSVAALDGMLGGGGGSTPQFMSMDLPYLESVDVDVSLGLSCRVSATIATPFDIGLQLLDTSLFQIGNLFEVQVGYPRSGRFTPWVSVMMAKPSIRISGDEGMSLTLNGDGGGFAALRGSSGKTYSGKSYREIVEEIADFHQWNTVFPDESDELLTKTRESVSQSHMTDWFFIQHIVRSAGCDAFLSPNEDGKRTLFVIRRKDALNKKPKVRLLMRGNPNFDTDFPILDFESEAEGVWLPGAAVVVKSQDIDPDDRRLVTAEATSETTREPSLGDAGVPSDGTATIEGERVQLVSSGGDEERSGEYLTTSARDPRGQQEIAQAHRDESMLRGGMNASITTYGLPELFPGEIVEVTGLGIFNSNYLITEMTWSANSSEFLSKLKCLNNASASGMIDDTFLVDPASSNTEQVEASEEADSGGDLVVEARSAE